MVIDKILALNYLLAKESKITKLLHDITLCLHLTDHFKKTPFLMT